VISACPRDGFVVIEAEAVPHHPEWISPLGSKLGIVERCDSGLCSSQ
jgi:hypothetical protein